MRPWKHGAEATSRKQIPSVAGGVRGAADRAGSGVGTPGLPLPKHSTPFPGRGGAGRLAGPYRSCQGASAASDDAGGGHGHTETLGWAPRQVQGGHSMHPPKKTALQGSGRCCGPHSYSVPCPASSKRGVQTLCSAGPGDRAQGCRRGCGTQRPPQPHAGTPWEGP